MGALLPYTQKAHWRTHLNRKYGIFLSQFVRFIDDANTKCGQKSNFNVSISNFDRGYIYI